ncbi:hypothetical protein [Chitinibacter tainanensis]|nr:hypothetical protein [Chitinibacter tainanensis]
MQTTSQAGQSELAAARQSRGHCASMLETHDVLTEKCHIHAAQC